MPDLQWMAIDAVKPNVRNARTHPKKQIRQIADSITAFGFVVPVLVDEQGNIIAGHARYEAANQCGLKQIPVIQVQGLSEAKRRALALADNKIAANAGWDREKLAVELPALSELLVEEGLDISITGFAPVEIDQILTDFETDCSDPADEIDPKWLSARAVSEPGDRWILGQHVILCGDARDRSTLNLLMQGRLAAMAFLDPPYNLPVKGIVGRGRIKHQEFSMGSGEFSPVEFVDFLKATLGAAALVSRSGAVHFVCMDWRHVGELLEASRAIYGQILNLAVWVKSNAGQGSFYRSQHELVGVFRVGDTPNLNNIELGRHGRHRSNVWHYAGVNSFRTGRLDDLASHPTVKPIALVADAVKDCTKRGDIVLDTFSGSGTTILAAERVGRHARALEIEPRFVDVAIRRWEAFTGKDAVHAETRLTFDETAASSDAQLCSSSARHVEG